MKKYILIIVLGALLMSCGGGSSGDEPTPTPTPPGAFNLSAPANNQPCTTGSIVATDPTKLNVLFQWGTSSGATDYVLRVSASNETSHYPTNNTSKNLMLDRGKTYTWSVTARNSDGEKTTATYSFTAEGVSVVNYAPYSAIINNISVTADNKLSMTWTGSDPDHDANELQYQIKIYENDSLILTTGTMTTTSFVMTSTVFSHTTYRVGVTTIDPDGATSTSYEYLVTD